MAAKKNTPVSKEVLEQARQRAEQTRQQLQHRPSPAELLSPEELADAAPFYLVLREYIRQLKSVREAESLTLADVSERSGMAVESLSRLETGAQTNPTWKTLGLYAAALGCQPVLFSERLPQKNHNEPQVIRFEDTTQQIRNRLVTSIRDVNLMLSESMSSAPIASRAAGS